MINNHNRRLLDEYIHIFSTGINDFNGVSIKKFTQ